MSEETATPRPLGAGDGARMTIGAEVSGDGAAGQGVTRRPGLQGAPGAGLPDGLGTTVHAEGVADQFRHYRPGNSVEYLIDGVAVFRRIHELLEEMALVPTGHAAYLHVALWECDANTALLDPAPPGED